MVRGQNVKWISFLQQPHSIKIFLIYQNRIKQTRCKKYWCIYVLNDFYHLSMKHNSCNWYFHYPPDDHHWRDCFSQWESWKRKFSSRCASKKRKSTMEKRMRSISNICRKNLQLHPRKWSSRCWNNLRSLCGWFFFVFISSRKKNKFYISRGWDTLEMD